MGIFQRGPSRQEIARQRLEEEVNLGDATGFHFYERDANLPPDRRRRAFARLIERMSENPLLPPETRSQMRQNAEIIRSIQEQPSPSLPQRFFQRIRSLRE
ncbi:MAG TPA: hypothetical protein VLB73_02520 [Patescibacteria group bacterium]|nr:hypothetical protein [Patescibacteria group bacterium]